MVVKPSMNRSALFRRRECVSAFTLIELLTVIVIIAVLMGIFMPLASTIKARADGAQCLSNLRQIGLAIGGYTADHDSTLPGPLEAGQLPTYSTADTASLAGFLAPYLGLPAATGAPQKAPVFICPAYAKGDPGLDQPVYAIQQITNSPANQWPFGLPGGASQPPLKLSALTMINDATQNHISAATIIALRDYASAQSRLVTTTVTFSTVTPVHRTFLNALFFDWHVGPVNTATFQPQ